MSVSGEQRSTAESEALAELAAFPLLDGLYGRRSRRFGMGAEIPDGPLAYRSEHEPLPLSDLERMLVLSAMGGTTGWHYAITRHARYAPHASNYSAGAAGRTFRRRPASIPPSSSSPTTRGFSSSRRATPGRSSTRPRRS
jgi:hypothetical protein